MLQKTKGVVLANHPYNDKYSIVHIFTEEFGRMAYLLPQRKSKKQLLSKVFFMPLSLIEIEADCSGRREIYPMKEVRCLYPLHRIHTSPVKSSLLFFIAEALSKALHEAPADKRLFGYIEEAVLFLEATEQSVANFHILFLYRLARFLGFPPNLENYSEESYFDMVDGCFSAFPPIHKHYLSPGESKILHSLSRMDFSNASLFSFTKSERDAVLTYFLEYFRLHIPNFSNLKTYEVLQEVFS